MNAPTSTLPAEVIVSHTRRIGCDGGGGVLGHPLVYLTLSRTGAIDCPYCGRRYVLADDVNDDEH
jgi:uncharacterized Zn-finger protein